MNVLDGFLIAAIMSVVVMVACIPLIFTFLHKQKYNPSFVSSLIACICLFAISLINSIACFSIRGNIDPENVHVEVETKLVEQNGYFVRSRDKRKLFRFLDVKDETNHLSRYKVRKTKYYYEEKTFFGYAFNRYLTEYKLPSGYLVYCYQDDEKMNTLCVRNENYTDFISFYTTNFIFD